MEYWNGYGRKTVNVLGAPYSITVCTEKEEPRLHDCDGFCDESVQEIFVENFQSEQEDPRSKKNLLLQTQKVIRHELVHAFLYESGLAECSSWAKNEEMVDWIAQQAPKLVQAWKEAEAI